MCNSDSEVFRSVEVPSRPMQNQIVNAQKLNSVIYVTRLTAIKTKPAFCALHRMKRQLSYCVADVTIVLTLSTFVSF